MTTPVTWPERARCAIMMTFDLDGESPWIQRDPALADRYLHMSMGSYGPKTGMPRILDLLDRYDLKTCIFIPGWIVERYPALCEEIVKRGHEVGQHGYLHERPSSLKSRDEEEALLVKSLDIFKKVLGVTPLGSRSPSADPSQHTMELLKKHGFVYHSNALDTDLPYCIETSMGPLVEVAVLPDFVTTPHDLLTDRRVVLDDPAGNEDARLDIVAIEHVENARHACLGPVGGHRHVEKPVGERRISSKPG